MTQPYPWTPNDPQNNPPLPSPDESPNDPPGTPPPIHRPIPGEPPHAPLPEEPPSPSRSMRSMNGSPGIPRVSTICVRPGRTVG
jgi:hypothetical protein